MFQNFIELYSGYIGTEPQCLKQWDTWIHTSIFIDVCMWVDINALMYGRSWLLIIMKRFEYDVLLSARRAPHELSFSCIHSATWLTSDAIRSTQYVDIARERIVFRISATVCYSSTVLSVALATRRLQLFFGVASLVWWNWRGIMLLIIEATFGFCWHC